MSGLEHDYTIEVQTSQGSEEIHIIERGEGNHIFIFWHGAFVDNHFFSWDFFLPEGKVVLAGLPGHGPIRECSRADYNRWTMQQFIDAGLEVVRKYYDGLPVTLAGYSLGGMVALGVALDAPKLVDRLILVAPLVSNDLAGLSKLLKMTAWFTPLTRMLVTPVVKSAKKSVDGFLKSQKNFIADKQAFYGNPNTTAALKKYYGYFNRIPLRTALNLSVGVYRLDRKINLRRKIQESPFDIPTLILHGDKDNVVPIKQSKWLVSNLPRAELAIIPGAGHISFFENEENFFEQLNVWCRQHPINP